MAHRFFAQSPISSGHTRLDGSEAHHLANVMRATVGAEVVLFDGSGAEFAARVTRIGRSGVDLEVLARCDVNREAARELTLGVALPKGDRQRWLVEKAVELGVCRLTPLEIARGVARPTEQAIARLRRTVIEASKQCGRNRLMEIMPPTAFADYVATVPNNADRLAAHPVQTGGDQSTRSLASSTGAVYLAVGGEGGFTSDEVSAAAACGWQFVDLGPRILRVETAALALAAWAVLR